MDIYPVCVPDSRSFHAAVTKVKSGKGASAFSERTDDSSAMQYFQVLYVTIMSVSSLLVCALQLECTLKQ